MKTLRKYLDCTSSSAILRKCCSLLPFSIFDHPIWTHLHNKTDITGRNVVRLANHAAEEIDAFSQRRLSLKGSERVLA